MHEKKMDEILSNLAEKAQERQFDGQVENHNFSENYNNKKQKLINKIKPERKFKLHKAVAVAAAILIIAGLSLTAIAVATNMFKFNVTPNESNDSVKVNIEEVSEDGTSSAEEKYVPPIEITPNYLPEGYSEFQGKYYLNGDPDNFGLTIFDAAGISNEGEEFDVSNCEEVQLDNAKALIIKKEGYDVYWHIYLLFEESGHVVRIYGADTLPEEEIIKVCENITIKEVPEQDPDRTYKVFKFDNNENAEEAIYENEEIPFKNSKVVGIGEFTRCYADEELKAYEEKVNYAVKSINITDKVQKDLINRDTAFDYDRVMEYINDDGTLKPYTRTVEEWENKALVEKEIGTVKMKNVEITIEVKNDSEAHFKDIYMNPCWIALKANSGGGYDYVSELDVAGYQTTENFRYSSRYDITSDQDGYYFDASANPQNKHFNFIEVKPNETKEIHVWFAIPEDMIDDAYIFFNEGLDRYESLIKIK
jgi:hypothetical protein